MKEGKSTKKTIKDFFRNSKGKVWFAINMFFTIIYLFWRIFFTIPFGYGFISMFAGIGLLIVEVIGMLEAFVHYINMYTVEQAPFPKITEDDVWPHVDVFISTYSEEPELLYKTINGCKHMKYPDLSKVHIYLCDDGHREEMKILAKQMGVNYLDRDNHDGAKAGNLNHALAHTTSPLIVTFDADMIPRSNFLLRTIPYFIDADRRNKGRKEEDRIELGLLQSPQNFYNLDLFQFNLHSESRIPNEQDYFYKDIQVARTRSNSVIYGGSNTVLLRKALEDVGGFYTNAITEDFATGILIESKQYVSLGIPEPLASGLSPQDLHNLIQQRIRWGRGVISTGRKIHILRSSHLSLQQKLNYWASILYWYAPVKRLFYIMSPILFATFGFMVFRCTLPEVLLFWLPMYISSNISLRMLSGNIRTTKWTGVYETILFPFMLLPILMESIGISLKKFKVTQKTGIKSEKGKNVIYMIPFLVLIVLSIIGIVRCVLMMLESGTITPIVILFWLVFNLYLLIMSLFFVDGRVLYRKSERQKIDLLCRVKYENNEYYGMTVDASEEGIAIVMEKPYFFEENKDVHIYIQTDDYKAHVTGRVVHTSEREGKYHFALKVIDTNGTYDDWLGVLYDRIPLLPYEIKKDSGVFEDLMINMKRRIMPQFFHKRQYPRVLVERSVEVKTDNDESILLYDFNYVACTLKGSNTPKEFNMTIKDGLVLNCVYDRKTPNELYLYNITNYDKYISDVDNREAILNWLFTLKESKVEKTVIQEEKKVDHTFNEMDLLDD